jgi:hypothetical protein
LTLIPNPLKNVSPSPGTKIMSMHRIQRAITRSKELSQIPWRPTPDGPTPSRSFAIGDPQTTTQKLFSILDAHRLLGDDGMLSPDVALVSIGDHFDYAASPEECRAEGGLFLRWLAEHPANQTHIIVGNHDLCRVMELAPFTDEVYQQAQREARLLTEDEFLQKYPSVPSPGSTLKDFLGFSASQRSLMQELLLGGRLRLSLHVVTEAGHDALVTHAAVTEREFFLLGVDGEEASVARRSTLVRDAHQAAMVRASALNRYLQDAIERVRDDWSSGKIHTPLSLSPVHEMGFAGQEGGGLLYHRPANPERFFSSTTQKKLYSNGASSAHPGEPSSSSKPRGKHEQSESSEPHAQMREKHERSESAEQRAHMRVLINKQWEFDAKMPRRFDPRTLPLGILQICGHTGHSKCLSSLGDWVTPEAKKRAIGGLRTLTATRENVNYHVGIVTPNPDEATLYMIDIEIHKEQSEYPLLPLRSVHS